MDLLFKEEKTIIAPRNPKNVVVQHAWREKYSQKGKEYAQHSNRLPTVQLSLLYYKSTSQQVKRLSKLQKMPSGREFSGPTRKKRWLYW
jgi:hypothetical protein